MSVTSISDISSIEDCSDLNNIDPKVFENVLSLSDSSGFGTLPNEEENKDKNSITLKKWVPCIENLKGNHGTKYVWVEGVLDVTFSS